MVKYGVLIGINYRNTSSELYGCINDVNNVKTFLQSQLGYTRFITLTDDTPIKPTKGNILMVMNILVRSLRPGDEAWFHYSGHGSLMIDRNRDEESGYDSSIAPIDYEKTGLISDDIIRSNLVQRVPRGVKLYIVLDACHSGTGCDLRYKHDDSSYLISENSVPNTYVPSDWILRQTLREFKKYNKIPGEVYCISGCQDHQTSADAYIESDKMYGGALSSILLSLLKSNDLKTYKWKHLLKDICCSEKIKGYTQQTAITSGNPLNMENAVFNISIPIKPPTIKRGVEVVTTNLFQSNKMYVNKNRNTSKKMILT